MASDINSVHQEGQYVANILQVLQTASSLSGVTDVPRAFVPTGQLGVQWCDGGSMAPLAVADVHSWTGLVLDGHSQLPSAGGMRAVILGAVGGTGLPETNTGSRFAETESRKS